MRDSGSWGWGESASGRGPAALNLLLGCGFRPRGCGFAPCGPTAAGQRFTQLGTRCSPGRDLGLGAGWSAEGLPWPWRDLRALPGLLPSLSVLPQRAGGAGRSSPTTTTATTEYEFSTEWDLSLLFPTALANPSECPKSEDVLRGRLIGLLLWGLLVLLIAFVTA